MRTIEGAVVLGALGLMLTACSGGSEGSGNDIGGVDEVVIDPPAGGALSVSSDNAAEISGEVIVATLGLVEFGDAFGTGPFASTNANDALAQARVVSNKAVGNLSKLQLVSQSHRKTQITETIDCLVSGSVTVSAALEDPLTITTGDSYMSQFDACNDGAGLFTDGGLDFVITEFVGDINDVLFGGGFRMGTAITTTNLEISFDGITSVQDGEFTTVFDTTNAPITRVEFFGPRFSTRVVGGDSFVLINFDMTSTVDEGQFPNFYTIDSSGTLDSGSLGGTVIFSTVQPFQGFGDEFPFTGEQLATGADGSSVRLIALDSVNVRLEIDDNGDGAVDQTTDTTWSALTAGT